MMTVMSRRAVFLDKDGTLIENVPYNTDPAKIRLMAGAANAVRMIHSQGYQIVVVTNQSGVARGIFKEEAIEGTEKAIQEILLRESDAQLDGFYYCPHHPDGVVEKYAVSCTCRKPQPGMFFQASCDLLIHLERSWMVGDILDDIEAGNRAGCRTILLDNGNETEWQLTPDRIPDYYAANMTEAAELIMAFG